MIVADRGVCIGTGMCSLVAPQLFDQDSDGFVIVLREAESDEDVEAVGEAVEACPSMALLWHEPISARTSEADDVS